MGKLVRDRIPDIIELNEGRKPKTSIIPSSKIEEAICKKLHEEVGEVSTAFLTKHEDNDMQLAAELADLLEVVELICCFRSIPLERVREVQRVKRNHKGCFSRLISLDE